MKIKLDQLFLKMAENEFSRQQLADLSGISYARLSEYIRTKRCGTAQAGKIAHALGCEVSDIAEPEVYY